MFVDEVAGDIVLPGRPVNTFAIEYGNGLRITWKAMFDRKVVV